MWAPLGTVNHTASWHPEPVFRGTWGVLSTSISTIGLCVWTAVHLNIPEHRKFNRYFWDKVMWVVIGLFAPEIICLMAFGQWRQHKKFQRAMQNILRSRVREPPPPDQESGCHVAPHDFRWTSTHSFYAIMGGFAFDISQSPEDMILPNERARLTLTPNALIFLAETEPELIPRISQEDINDKSKSGGIGKVIAFWQALWFCAQFINRLAQSYSVSLLELNTFVHCICAFIVYFIFWWNKPLDIMEPTLIPVRTATTRQLCAAMCAKSAVGLYPCQVDLKKLPSWVKWLFRLLRAKTFARIVVGAQNAQANKAESTGSNLFEDTIPAKLPERGSIHTRPHCLSGPHVHGEVITEGEPQSQNPASSDEPDGPFHSGPSQDSPKQEAEEPETFQLTAGQTRFGISFSRTYVKILGITLSSSTKHACLSLQTTAGMRRRCRLAGQSLHEYDMARDPSSTIQRIFQHFTANDFVVPRAKNVPHYWAALIRDSTRISAMREAIISWISMLLLYVRLLTKFLTIILANPTTKSARRGFGLRREQSQRDAESIYHAGRVVLSVLGTSVAFFVASFFYGGIHLLLAWNGPINTTTELLLWRICCFTLLAPSAIVLLLPIFFIILLFLAYSLDMIISFCRLDDLKKRISDSVCSDSIKNFVDNLVENLILAAGVFFSVLLTISLLAFSGLYLFSRVYVVVECLISLPYAPASVFSLPSWSAYFIHVS